MSLRQEINDLRTSLYTSIDLFQSLPTVTPTSFPFEVRYIKFPPNKNSIENQIIIHADIVNSDATHLFLIDRNTLRQYSLEKLNSFDLKVIPNSELNNIVDEQNRIKELNTKYNTLVTLIRANLSNRLSKLLDLEESDIDNLINILQ